MTPQTTYELYGHEAAEKTLIDSWASGRMHHAWLITGPRGVGKATLAHRFARFLLTRGDPDTGGGLFGDTTVLPDSLHVSQEEPMARRIAAGGHGDLKVLTRGVDPKSGRERSEIIIGDVRAANDFFSMTSSEGGWRIAIVDSADELNRNAANALLKTLEEPPRRSMLILVAHMPGRVLPTIRSRCRKLALKPLANDQTAQLIRAAQPEMTDADVNVLAALSDGSPGRGLALAEAEGLTIYHALLSMLVRLPDLSPRAVLELADMVGARGKDDVFIIFGDLLADILARLVRFTATDGEEVVPGEAETLSRMSGMTDLDQWIEVWEKSNDLIRQCNAINLDRKQVVISIMDLISGTVRGNVA